MTDHRGLDEIARELDKTQRKIEKAVRAPLREARQPGFLERVNRLVDKREALETEYQEAIRRFAELKRSLIEAQS